MSEQESTGEMFANLERLIHKATDFRLDAQPDDPLLASHAARSEVERQDSDIYIPSSESNGEISPSQTPVPLRRSKKQQHKMKPGNPLSCSHVAPVNPDVVETSKQAIKLRETRPANPICNDDANNQQTTNASHTEHINYPTTVDQPFSYRTYTEIIKDKMKIYVDLPLVVEEPVHRRMPIAIDRFPGPVIVNGREEFYVESIYRELEPVDKDVRGRFFIVIWAGWPTVFATVEPESNVQHCVALELFEESSHGNLIGTGSNRKLRCTAIRSGIASEMKTVIKGNNWPSDDLDKIFEKRVKNGTYKRRIGFVSKNRSRVEMFHLEYDLWVEVYNFLNNQKHIFIEEAFCGNYFGRGVRFEETQGIIQSKKLERSWDAINKSVSKHMSSMSYNELGEKWCIFLLVSQIGSFDANMNEPIVDGEGFRTHASVFLARNKLVPENKKPDRKYFYYEPIQHDSNAKYQPIEFILGQKLRFTSELNVIYGQQFETHDCLYRCMRWIHDVCNGGVVNFENSSDKIYDLSKRNSAQ